MRDVDLPATLADAIRAHGASDYPDECCGYLIAEAESEREPGARRIVAVERASNGFDGERRRRYAIPPEELRRVERRTEEAGRVVIGFYHSHPDHPARPSKFDQDHAWPWYTYVVLRVSADGAEELGAFELDPDSGAFGEVPLRIAPTIREPMVPR